MFWKFEERKANGEVLPSMLLEIVMKPRGSFLAGLVP